MERLTSRREIENRSKAFIQEVTATPHNTARPLTEKTLNRIANKVAKQTIKKIEECGGQITD